MRNVYREPYQIGGCGFDLSDPVEMKKLLKDWAYATTTIEEGDGEPYLVKTLTFSLSDAKSQKRLSVWGDNSLYLVEELTFPLSDPVECEKRLEALGKNLKRYLRVTEGLYAEEANDDKRVYNREFEYTVFLTEEKTYTTGSKYECAVSIQKNERIDGSIAITDTLGLEDNLSQKIQDAYEEEAEAKDMWLRATMNGVLSDVLLSEGGLSFEEFQKKANSSVGYTPFMEFRVGDYEYQKAIYKIELTRKNLNANTQLYDYAVHVDIPDTIDRGESAVDGETKIYFNKHYYHAPEVNVTVVSGTEVIMPTILDLDGEDDNGRYFTVILQNTAGESKAGRISWSARGY